MQAFIDRFKDSINGVLTGFDRIVFKGSISSLAYLSGAQAYLRWKGILNKDYKTWMLRQTQALVDSVEKYVQEERGRKITPLSSWRIRKEEEAHKLQKKEQIASGLIGVWSCQEMGKTYHAYFDPGAGKPQIRPRQTPCKHLYFYFDHWRYGFMNVRIQTWFPFHIQVCMNGREWLRRSLEAEGVEFLCKGNKFLHVGDYERAQQLLDEQKATLWNDILNSCLPIVFPTIGETFDEGLPSYYWTLWQSEWATDFIFDSPDKLTPIIRNLTRHAFMTETAERILRYLDRPLTKAETIRADFAGDVITRFSSFNKGIRVRHWVDSNSVKAYNEQNNLRIETTVNDPAKFKAHRSTFGDSAATKKRRPLRKGVVDAALRAQVSQEVNDRFIAGVAQMNDDQPIGPLIEDITRPRTIRGRRIRALDPFGKDRALLQILTDPAILITGITNAKIRQKLQGKTWAKGKTDKQLSACITRSIRLLRDHGILRKIPAQRAYQISTKGRKLIHLIPAVMDASTQQLMELAA
jgi:hypothetical protein